jgi:hypothetical protein
VSYSPDWTRIIALLLCSSVFGFVVWLIRERRLREKYALLWLSTSLVIILLTVSRHVLEATALAIGIFYPPSLLFLVGVLFLLLVAIGQSVTLSRLSESNQHLAQEVALLRKMIEDDRVQREKDSGKEKAQGGEVSAPVANA